MTAIYLQGFVCPHDENIESTIKFQSLPIDVSLESPNYLSIIPNGANDRLIGVTGDLSINYQYDKDNAAHVQEIGRLASLYSTIDHYNGILTLTVNFDSYPINSWKEHSINDSSWASSILEYTKITTNTGPSLLYRFVVDELPTRFSYCKVSSQSIVMDTPYNKTIYTYGNLLEVEDINGKSELITDNNRRPHKFSGKTTFNCQSECYILVIEDL